ncbi:glycoside hydrolase family 16 protein [Pseudonocardia xinjiangensis]|uniref:glycoside hydrolase family 16 protein n=1 Tax=Pseudonocardia xinjiangensis TaxID=75289 RepID=UPI003D94CA59
MSRIARRMRSSVVCAGLVVVLAACAGGPGPSSAAPDNAPDLFEALPPTSTVPTPTPTTSAPTTTPSPTSGRPSATPGPHSGGSRGASGAHVASGSGGGGTTWHPAGGDEFNGPVLDSKGWDLYDSVGGFGTGYRKPEAISQSDGTLKITAKGDVSGGMGQTTGQLYGRWEFRARTDAGRGFGSAILLWPDSEKWPEDGELDIMEVPGENRDLAHFVVHWGPDGTDNVNGTSVPGDYTKWHTFALEWLPDRITWYVDGVKKYENKDKTVIPTKPMHLTIQLDQGPKKDWIPPRDDTTPDEVNLEVDWVRISKM